MHPVVIDTNVLLSALWQPLGPSARMLRAVQRQELVPMFDRRVLDEYLEVLTRPRFASRIGPEIARATVATIEHTGLDVTDSIEPYAGRLPDEADRPFIEVALATGAPIITGNIRHFPAELGIKAVLPADLVQRLGL